MSVKVSQRSWFDLTLGMMIGLVILATIVPVSYYTVFRWADSVVCYGRVGNDLHIQPNRDTIQTFMEKNLAFVSTRDEAVVLLQKIGPVTSDGKKMLSISAGSSETLHVSPCWHPLNNFTVTLNYTSDDQSLYSYYLEQP